jgi:hypothetical protein
MTLLEMMVNEFWMAFYAVHLLRELTESQASHHLLWKTGALHLKLIIVSCGHPTHSALNVQLFENSLFSFWRDAHIIIISSHLFGG